MGRGLGIVGAKRWGYGMGKLKCRVEACGR